MRPSMLLLHLHVHESELLLAKTKGAISFEPDLFFV